MLDYTAIEIFTSEQARTGTKPTVDAVLHYIRGLKIAARCIVTRGIAGLYETGEEATGRLEILSYNLPIRIYILLPAAEAGRVLDGLNPMIGDGIITLHEVNVISYRARNVFFPRQLLVRDVMTPDPKRVSADGSLRDAAEMLLSGIFSGLPVVDEKDRPVGVITQGDLIGRGGLPLRLGLIAESNGHRRESVLNGLGFRKAAEVMTAPAVTITDDRLLTEAVDRMLTRDVKRLPVVDRTGRLTGMLSRLDIFRTVMREAPDWKSFEAQKIEVAALMRVKDILRRDTHTVSPEAAIDEVIRVIDRNDIQRVAVVDAEGRLLGLISDRDLLRYFKKEDAGIWGVLTRAKRMREQDACRDGMPQCLTETTAGTVMNTALITVGEEALIEEAIGLMTEKAIKRLPVVDEAGLFKGMISRDSLLRTGFGGLTRQDP